MAHAKLSPSSAIRWMNCPGSIVVSEGVPERRSPAAARGTVCHLMAEEALVTGKLPEHWLGQEVAADETTVVTVDQSMIDTVEHYVGTAREYIDGADEWAVEEKLPLLHLTGEDAHGTADLIVMRGNELQVHDLKAGHHEVQAENNPQLKIYALAAMCKYAIVGDFDTVLTVIHQPEHGGPKEWRYTVEELDEFSGEVAAAAERVKEAISARPVMSKGDWEWNYLRPSTDACRFCPARATCPALKATVDEAVAVEFEALDDDTLGESMAKVELVEAWCKEVRAETERRLLQGKPVRGFKLVQGRRGPRKWGDASAAETVLLSALGEAAYDKSVISPVTAEKKLKNSNQWPAVAALITQSEGKPSVAPESDKRDAITSTSVIDEFEAV